MRVCMSTVGSEDVLHLVAVATSRQAWCSCLLDLIQR